MRSHAKASSSGSAGSAQTTFAVDRKAWSSFVLACFCVLGFAALLGMSASVVRATSGPCPNAALRVDNGSTKLPDCRAYEVVSPFDKNGNDILYGHTTRAAEQGGALSYISFGPFAGGGGSTSLVSQYLAEREGNGWTTRNINPPLDPDGNIGSSDLFPYIGLAPDLSAGVSAHPQVYDDGVAMQLFRFAASSGSFERLTRPFASLPSIPSFDNSLGSSFVGGSSDFRHVVFISNRALTPDAPADLDNADTTYFLYEWFDGDLRLVSVNPPELGGEPMRSPIGLGLGNARSIAFRYPYPGDFAVSADGSHIYFNVNDYGAAPADPQGLYLRYDDPGDPVPAETVAVSRTERTDCFEDPTCGGNGEPDLLSAQTIEKAYFQAASADGSVAFFVSSERLTDDAQTEDLYRWDSTAPAGHRLEDLAPGSDVGEGFQAPGESPGSIGGVVGASADGTSLYFVGKGDLDGAGPATAGAANLYLWHEGDGVSLVTVLDGADFAIWSAIAAVNNNDENVTYRGSRVSPDGRYLLLRSRVKLTAYDNAGTYQLYLYDSAVDQFTCVSCNPRTSQSQSNTSLHALPEQLNVPYWLTRNLSEDGHQVIFESSEALVAADTNGKVDVYRWTAADGPQLITSGQSAADTHFLDASADGSDVYFTSRQQLVPGDVDQGVDAYDARMGGGFPIPPPSPPCEGDACLPPPNVPNDPTPTSSSFSGSGNVKAIPNARCANGKRKVRAKGGKTRCVSKKRSHRSTKRQNANSNRRAGR